MVIFNHKLYAGFLIFCAITVIISSVSAVGVGLGPSDLKISNVLRGTVVERTVVVYNLGDEDSQIQLSADGPAGAWVTYYLPTSNDMPITSVDAKGRETLTVIARFTVPPDTANGMYDATLRARLTPTGVKIADVGVTATMEATTKVSIDVTGQQSVSGTVDYISVDDTEVNFPLSIRVLFRNSGNVAVNPEITAIISGAGNVLDTVSSSSTTVNAGKSEVIFIHWNKTNINPGNYSADVNVGIAGSKISGSTIPFMVHPVGTLSRQGTLTDLTFSGTPAKDSMVKIIGTFENTGKIETKAKMIGEVYRGTTLVDSFTSEELSIPVYRNEEISYYLKIMDTGSYTIKAYVLYDGKKTEIKEVSFSTNGVKSTASGTQAPLSPAVAILALTGIGLLVSLRRKS